MSLIIKVDEQSKQTNSNAFNENVEMELHFNKIQTQSEIESLEKQLQNSEYHNKLVNKMIYIIYYC